MPLRALLVLAVTALAACGGDDAAETPPVKNVLTHTLPLLNGEPQDLAEYRGRPVLIVNTASECGYTPQFGELQKLHESRPELVVLGFPSNDFAGQEPRSNGEIAEFCEANFGVEFPMFAKVEVTGDDAHPLFKALGEPEWNFNKYLLGRTGRLVQRWGASTEPDDADLLTAVDAAIDSPAV
jgi:glutathione peroxidase